MNIAHHESDCFLELTVSVCAGFTAKTINPELAPAGGKIRGGDLLNCIGGHTSIIAAVGW